MSCESRLRQTEHDMRGRLSIRALTYCVAKRSTVTLSYSRRPAAPVNSKRGVRPRKAPMKTTKQLRLRLALSVFLLASLSLPGRAQDSAPYIEGSVWQISFIKIKPGMDDDYLKTLKNSWQALVDEGKNDGYVLSSKILYGEASNPEDFAVILMFEVRNMAALDGFRAKEDAALQKVFGANVDQATKSLAAKRVEMREIYGDKLMREITLK